MVNIAPQEPIGPTELRADSGGWERLTRMRAVWVTQVVFRDFFFNHLVKLTIQPDNTPALIAVMPSSGEKAKYQIRMEFTGRNFVAGAAEYPPELWLGADGSLSPSFLRAHAQDRKTALREVLHHVGRETVHHKNEVV